MTTAIPATLTPATDAEKLDVYRVALAAHTQATTILTADHRILRDQLERASLSVVLNVSEGAGRRSPKDKRRHYAIARGSALECAAAVVVVAIRRLGEPSEVTALHALFVDVIQMLTKMDEALA